MMPADSPEHGLMASKAGGWIRRASAVGFGILFALYPLMVYLALTRFGARATGVLVLAAVALWGLRAGVAGTGGFRALMLQGGGVTLLALGAVVTDSPAVIQQMPVLISVFLLVTFAATLVRPPPMIERYARMMQPDLTDAEARHCRIVTWVWVGFFVLNAMVAEYLVLFGSLQAWALYAGGIAYGLMGLLFVIEYVVRKARFGRFQDHVLDRTLARMLGREPAMGKAGDRTREAP
jgi:uncharacterized membrane protein